MLSKLKNELNRELADFILQIDKLHSLSRISPLLFRSIKEFFLRDGKRLRPILFIIGYRGFAKREAARLYTSALAIELLHDFLLVHDDIIDKSDTRRGRPSMHILFNNYLAKHKKDIKFDGQDLALIVGDVMYALSIHAFLSIKEKAERKEKALRNFIQAAMYTGSGEFIELINGIKNIENITKNDIFKVYDYKTAIYTFACPLSTGAILAGASQKQINNLFQYGVELGRAFQIKDDILGVFSDEKKIGKSSLTDLREAKKTLLIWYAYNHSRTDNQRLIKKIFSKDNADQNDLSIIRKIIVESKSLEYAQKEILRLNNKACTILKKSSMKKEYKESLTKYINGLLQV